MDNLKDSNWPLNDIVSGNWSSKYKIQENLPLYFKINDNVKVMRHLQKEVKENLSFKTKVAEQNKKLLEFKEIKIWLKVENNIIKMSLYDVYKSFIAHLRYNSYENQLFNGQEVSLVGPLGPFKSMPLIDCLNEEVIDKFIFDSLIKNKLPLRSSRLHTNSDINIEFGEEFIRKNTFKMRQLTETGILFSSDSEEVLSHLGDGGFVKVHMGTHGLSSYLRDESRLSPGTFFVPKKNDEFFFVKENHLRKSLSYRSGLTNEIFLYCRYRDILDSDAGKLCLETINKAKTQIDGFYAA